MIRRPRSLSELMTSASRSIARSLVAGEGAGGAEATLPTEAEYIATVLATSPIAYWPLNETSGSTADNAQGTAARDGSYTSVNLAQDELASGYSAVRLSGSGSYVNLYSTSLRDAFNPLLGTLMFHAIIHPDQWNDTSARRFVMLKVDGSNDFTIFKDTTANRLTLRHRAGGTAVSVNVDTSAAGNVDLTYSQLVQFAITWNKANNRFRAYINGTQVGSDVSGLGTWAGSLAEAWVGIDSSLAFPSKGHFGHVAIWTSELTQAQIESLRIDSSLPTMIRASSATKVSTLRTKMISRIWSGNGMPADGADAVTTGVAEILPVTPSNISRIDRYTVNMDDNVSSTIATLEPYLWRPTSPNGKCVIMVTGHTGTSTAWAAGNQGTLVKELVEANYTVCGMYMPFFDANALTTVANHNARAAIPTATLNDMKFFVEAPIRMINELDGEFSTFYMTGISGGGFTTAIVPAIDTRIGRSSQLAGSLPLYRHNISGTGPRDYEQFLPSLYTFMDFQDLYVMCASDGRRHRHALNSADPSSFPNSDYAAMTDFTAAVSAAITGGGTYTFVVDTNTSHNFSTTERAAILSFFNAA